jgi:multisubunit Na+/H+ antiporter MnhB subunit
MNNKRIIIAVLMVLFLVLAYSILQMPPIGLMENPAYNEVARYYLENSQTQTGSVNVIAAIITDFRAFDTLGETTVLFTAIAAVFSVLLTGDSHHE